MWAHVVKFCYDAMEQVVSAATLKKDEIIPKEHPSKISKFISLYGRESKIVRLLLKWLGERGKAQYVDIKEGKVIVPHELFKEEDAKLALRDCAEVVNEIKSLLEI